MADFLVTYYSSSLGRLEQWHPGFGQVLEDAPGTRGLFSARHYRREVEVVFADPLLIDAKQAARLAWILDLLRRTRDRPPAFVCHGRHEWAMVYSGAEIRHRESVPMRLPQAEIDAVVEEGPLCCSHYDAFRFFAPGTRSWNRFQPELMTRDEHEQAGCLHANMDLYKWAYKSMPWIGSDLLYGCFLFAIKAREIDMRASPYDLGGYGYEPIPIETPAGRAEYEREQRALCEEGQPLRSRLIETLDRVRAAVVQAPVRNQGCRD